MKIEAIFPRQNFAFDALGGENANAGNVNNNPPANGGKDAADPKTKPAETKQADNDREGLDRTAKAFGKGMGTLLGKNPAAGSDNPVGKTLGAIAAGPGLAEKAVFGFMGWAAGAITLGVFDTIRVLFGHKREQSYVEEYTRGMLGVVGIDAKKNAGEQPVRNIYGPPLKPIEHELSFLPEDDPLRAEYKEAQDLLKLYDPPDEDDDMGPNRQLGAQSNIHNVEDKIRARSKAIQKEINELPPSIRSAKSSQAILKDYQDRLATLNHLVETETRPHKLDDWLKALDRLEGQYPTLKRWLELKDLYDKQQNKKASSSNGVTYDLPANDKVAGLLIEPGTESQFALASNNSNPLSGVRPIPMTYDLPVNNKISGLIAKPQPEQQTTMSSASSNVVIQTAQQTPSEKQNPLFGVRPIPMTYDLPVNNKFAALTIAPIAQQQPVLSSQNLNIVQQGQLSVSKQSVVNLNNSDEKTKALTVQLQLRAKGLLA